MSSKDRIQEFKGRSLERGVLKRSSRDQNTLKVIRRPSRDDLLETEFPRGILKSEDFKKVF